MAQSNFRLELVFPHADKVLAGSDGTGDGAETLIADHVQAQFLVRRSLLEAVQARLGQHSACRQLRSRFARLEPTPPHPAGPLCAAMIDDARAAVVVSTLCDAADVLDRYPDCREVADDLLAIASSWADALV